MKKYLIFALALLLAACEKPVLDNEDAVTKKEANVILHFKQYEQESFTRAATDITELCSRLNIAIFDADGTKVKTVAQKESDAGYGTVTLPHTEDDVLTKLTVTALDQNDNTVKERVFENVPVSRNQVTRYTGSFFGIGGSGGSSDGTIRLTADPDWDSVNGYTF